MAQLEKLLLEPVPGAPLPTTARKPPLGSPSTASFLYAHFKEHGLGDDPEVAAAK